MLNFNLFEKHPIDKNAYKNTQVSENDFIVCYNMELLKVNT